MTAWKYADERAAAEESARLTYDLFDEKITEEYIRIRAQERALQRIRDEEAVGFTAEFESKIIDAADIETPDQQPYLVKKLIYLPGVTMLHSDPGVGKSICAMDLAFCVGLGFPEWCGYKIKRPVRSLYIFSEGAARLWKRRDAWLKKHSYTVDHLRGKDDFYLEPIPLNASEAYVDAVVKHAKGNGYGLIVIDTWATAKAGSDENAAGLMQQSLKGQEASPEQIGWDFIRDHDGEFKKSDIPKAMVGRGVLVRRLPIPVDDLINKGLASLEKRPVTEGDRKVTRKFVSVAPFCAT